MIRTVAMLIGGLLLLLVASPLHVLAKARAVHHKAIPMEPGHPPARHTPQSRLVSAATEPRPFAASRRLSCYLPLVTRPRS
jgi:hypothetical protein